MEKVQLYSADKIVNLRRGEKREKREEGRRRGEGRGEEGGREEGRRCRVVREEASERKDSRPFMHSIVSPNCM